VELVWNTVTTEWTGNVVKSLLMREDVAFTTPPVLQFCLGVLLRKEESHPELLDTVGEKPEALLLREVLPPTRVVPQSWEGLLHML